MTTIKCMVNGSEFIVDVEPHDMLVDVLREQLRLTGTKVGCREGECGACTVIMDGQAILSCLTPAVKAHGSRILTVEGLAHGGQLNPLQEAFLEHGAVQCGFCTPGMLMTAKDLLDHNPKPSMEEIKKGISGVLCRCTGYQKIIKAIHSASEKMSSETS